MPPLEDDYDPNEVVRQQLSLWRVASLLMVLIVLGGLVYVGARRALAASTPKSKTWFAPYVDSTLLPSYQFQDSAENLTPSLVLGFVATDSHSACKPAWGGTYDLDQAAVALNMDRRMVQFESTGGRVMVSFGGADLTDLAVSCSSVSQLEGAYLQVVERYGLRAIDLDVEGARPLSEAATLRRAEAIASLQRLMARNHEPLQVWLTLPAGPDGLPAAERQEVAVFLQHHVQLAGVNSLDLEFGNAKFPVTNMLSGVETSLTDAHSELTTIYQRAGQPKSSTAIWGRMGSTVLIGQSGIPKERFGLYDAQQLAKFATRVGLGRVSMWSLNRDSQCGTAFPVVGEVSNHCSGVAQGNLQFESIFDLLPGHSGWGEGPHAKATVAPGHDPYPAWQPDAAYEGGYLVVDKGDVYVAKYFTQGDSPDTPTQTASEDPWELLGPVLASDQSPTTTTLPVGTYPTWSPHQAYQQGTRVLYNGLPFVAKYYTLESSPGAVDVDPQYSPWQPLYKVPNEP